MLCCHRIASHGLSATAELLIDIGHKAQHYCLCHSMSAAAELSSSLRREIYAAWKKVAKPINENSSVDAADSEQRLCLVD